MALKTKDSIESPIFSKVLSNKNVRFYGVLAILMAVFTIFWLKNPAIETEADITGLAVEQEAKASGEACTASEECISKLCENSICISELGGLCTANGYCLSGHCYGGYCVRLEIGAVCTSNEECLSQICEGNKCVGITGDECISSEQCQEELKCENKVCI